MGGPWSTMVRRPESANCLARRGLTPSIPAAVERVTAPSGPTVEQTTTPDIPLSEGSVGGVRTSSGGSVGLSEGSVGGVRTLSGVVTEQTLGRAPARRGRVVGVSGVLKKGLLVVVVADIFG